ncbi:DUF637 domain-containing protein [Pseudomonas oryzihabitans]|uniref:DUF637 domain-containing protein n=1 Tax=Pseudomonas oryzihabitans TaxID=47885 RepID=UPI002895F30C|nr:DUF637 domain-containing protein [Pseudomonas oryzihabitans]MDT3723244.1 DUF637 domain-containing protein [Pseudomonas oryzihabitans]
MGATLKDTLSSDGMKNAMIAAGTAGVMSYASSNWFKTTVDPVSGKVTGAIPDLTNPGNFTRFAETQLLQGAVKGTLSEALGQGKFSDSLKGSVFSILQAAAFNQVGDLGKQWKLEDSGLGKTAMHAVVGGLLSEAMGGDFKTGAVAAGANEALIETLDKSPLLAGADQTEHQRLVNMASQLVGLVAAASVGGNVQQGAEIAGNAQAYNRQLHSFERQILDEKAQELQQTLGNTKSGESWETLLTLVGGAAVDSEDSQKLAALQASLKDSNPESWSLKQDLMQAQQVIDQLKGQRIALNWSNGNPIVADGDRVYAFAATDAQRQDHALFDVASNTGLYNAPGNDPVVPDKYVQQFGDYVAVKHQSEIASVSSDTLSKNDQWEALQGRTNSGLVDVTFADALGALPAGRAVRAGTALSTTLQATTREAEESIAGGLAKAVSQDTSRTGVPQWTVAAEDTYGARLAGSYKVGDTAYNGRISDVAEDFSYGLRESGAKGEAPKTERYFRVEGGGSGSATSQNRITVNADDSIKINPGCSGQLCVSVGSADHASYFLTNKRPDGSVVVFEVDAGLHKQIMDSAIPQRPIPGVPRDPSAPKIVDPNQPGVALELPKVWESLLENHSSNARAYSHDEFLKEFGR